LDSYLTEFTTAKKTVIRSKSLRIPEIIVNLCFITGVLGYHLVYKLQFFVERDDLTPDVRPIYAPTYKNWWTCSSEAGTCQYFVPEPDTLDYCTQEHEYPLWDEAKKEMVNSKIKIDCNPLDLDDGYREKAGELWITTLKTTVSEEKRVNVWSQTPGSNSREFASGAEQIIIFHGTLPRGLRLGVNTSTLGQMQGFLKYANETDAEARMIPFAKSGEWLPDRMTPTALKYDWSFLYPNRAVSGNDSKPEFLHSATGCFQVAEEAMGVYCHLSELLRAADVDLDTRGNRMKGATLKVHLRLTNADVQDFWSWPIGRKPKYIIEVSPQWGSKALMYQTYLYGQSRNARSRTDHYGIRLIMSPDSSWAEFCMLGLVSTLVIAAGVIKYANMFVTSVLVSTYASLGCSHITRLYRYNAKMHSAHEADVAHVKSFEEFEKHHHQSERAELELPFEKRRASEKADLELLFEKRRMSEKADLEQHVPYSRMHLHSSTLLAASTP